MSEPDTPDTGDLPRRIMAQVAPRAASKSAALTQLLRFRAEVLGDWVSADDVLIVSDPPHFSEDDQ